MKKCSHIDITAGKERQGLLTVTRLLANVIMGLSNAERNARWRAKHKAEVQRLREEASRHPLKPVLDAFEDRLVGELSKAAHERRQTNDRLDLVMRELLRLKQALGQVEIPQTPRISRRRPLGHD